MNTIKGEVSSQLNLFYGKSYKINKKHKINNLQLKNFFDYEYEDYELLKTVFCVAPYDICGFLYKNKLFYDKVDDYDLFISLFQSYFDEEAESFRRLVSFVFNCGELVIMQNNDEESFIFDIDNKMILVNKENYYSLRKQMRLMFNFTSENPPKFFNEYTKERFLEDKMEELEDNPSSENKITIEKLITAIVCSTSYTYDTALELYLSQFYSLIESIIKREQNRSVMFGLYSGNVDPKSVNLEKLSWLNKG